MNKIDTTKWKEFQLKDLFDIVLPIGDIQAQKMDDGIFPLVSSGQNNNGICKFVTHTIQSNLFPSNTITVDMFGKTFFHNYQYYCVSHGRVNILIPKFNINKYIALYIAQIIENTTIFKYEFLNMCSQGMLKKEIIKLPAKDNKPDFEYMENYMKSIFEKSKENIEALKKNKNEKKKINTIKWKEFKINDLFYKCELKKKDGFKKTNDTSLFCDDEFNLPLVNAKHGNNGIMYYGREEDFESEAMTIDIVQNGAIAVGDVYAQPQRTSILEDAYLIKPYEDIKLEAVLFYLATVLQKEIKQHFSYDNKCTWDKAKELYIHLPINNVNKPDFEYMENYMNDIMKSSQIKLSKLCDGFK